MFHRPSSLLGLVSGLRAFVWLVVLGLLVGLWLQVDRGVSWRYEGGDLIRGFLELVAIVGPLACLSGVWFAGFVRALARGWGRAFWAVWLGFFLTVLAFCLLWVLITSGNGQRFDWRDYAYGGTLMAGGVGLAFFGVWLWSALAAWLRPLPLKAAPTLRWRWAEVWAVTLLVSLFPYASTFQRRGSFHWPSDGSRWGYEQYGVLLLAIPILYGVAATLICLVAACQRGKWRVGSLIALAALFFAAHLLIAALLGHWPFSGMLLANALGSAVLMPLAALYVPRVYAGALALPRPLIGETQVLPRWGIGPALTAIPLIAITTAIAVLAPTETLKWQHREAAEARQAAWDEALNASEAEAQRMSDAQDRATYEALITQATYAFESIQQGRADALRRGLNRGEFPSVRRVYDPARSYPSLLVVGSRSYLDTTHIKAWPPVMAELEGLYALRFYNVTLGTWPALTTLTSVEKMEANGRLPIDTAPLGALTGLKTLSLGTSNHGLRLDTLHEFPALSEMSVYTQGVVSFGGSEASAPSASPLKSLTINAGRIDGAGGLARFAGLTQLWLETGRTPDGRDLCSVADFDFVRPMTALTSFRAVGVCASDATPLATLSQLESLTIRGTPLDDLSDLWMLENLERFDYSPSYR